MLMSPLSCKKAGADGKLLFCLFTLFLLLFTLQSSSAWAQSNQQPNQRSNQQSNQQPASASLTIPLIPIEGPVGPATADFVARQFANTDSNAPAIILRINTPGGLDQAMRQIVNTMLEAPVPVIAWVAPAGARAASAGMFIMMAADITAMSSTSNMGAATPVNANDPDNNVSQKVINDASAYMRTLAERKDRNADVAVTAIVDGSSFTADQALINGLIELVADSIPDLLATLNGQSIEKNGLTIPLNLSNASIEPRETDWRDDLLAFVAQPNIAYLLLTIGFYGIILEFYSPGVALGGILGVICLVLASYGLSLLPVNYAGASLMVLGLVLLCAELLTPGIAVLGAGGLLAFLLGSLLLIDTAEPAWQISRALIAATTVTTGALMALVLWSALKARKQPAASGVEHMLGQLAVALENFQQRGAVQLQGERWQAISDHPVRRGEHITVTRVDGLTLHVTKATHPDKHPDTAQES